MPEQMIALVKKYPREGAYLEEVEVPVCGADEVIIKVLATSICGTDVHIYKWNSWASSHLKLPLIFGHEFCGEVVEKGKGITKVKIGDIVSVESHIPCQRCYQCQNNMMHICNELKIIGIDTSGSFAQYVKVPEICLWRHQQSIKPEIAALMEPLGNAVHAVSSVDVREKTCAVFGCGPAGLFTIMLLKRLATSRIIALDIDRFRLVLAKQIGADLVLDASEMAQEALKDVYDRIMQETKNHGVDVTFEMSGSPQAIDLGLKALCSGGTFIAFGLPSDHIQLNLARDVIIKARKIIGIVGRHMYDTWNLMQKLINSGLDPSVVITHRFKLSEYEKAFDTIISRSQACGKVVMFPFIPKADTPMA